MATPTAGGATPDWKKMKVQELRDELTSRGLDTSGVKSTLIERLETTAVKDDNNAEITAEDGGRKDMDLDINEGAPALDEVDEKKVAATAPITTVPPVVAEDMAAEALPVTSILPPVDEVAEGVVSAAPPQSAVASATNGAAVAPSSDLEKKQRRAERFGLELMVSEGEKRRLRAARFGEITGTKTNGAAAKEDETSKMSPTLKDAEAVKRKARAARFGIEEVGDKPAVAASPTGTDDSKKKARLARFGLEIKLDPQEQEKKKLRAARFGLTTEAKPDVEPEKKVAVEEPVAT